ncbi:hypothetical protein AALA98_13280 [Lachnospiraceae bacterium 45-W7]
MDNKVTKSVLEKTVNAENSSQGAVSGKVKGHARGEYVNMEISLKKNYNAISKNGDTLEISEEARLLGVHTETEHLPLSDKNSITGSGKKIPDAALAGYSKEKLKQLYASKQITKQQYERILKKINIKKNDDFR